MLLTLWACSAEVPAPSPAAVEIGSAGVEEPPSAAPDAHPPENPRERPWPNIAVAPPGDGDRLYSKVRFLWVYPRPDQGSAWIGYLALGDDAPLKHGAATRADAGPGPSKRCRRWYALEPRGFACEGTDATLDGDDPDVVALRNGRARTEALPFTYAESLGTTVYLDLPPRKRQYFREDAFDAHMSDIAKRRAGESVPRLAGVDLRRTNNPPPPLLLHLGPRAMPQKTGGKYGFPEIVRGSTLAYFYSFDAGDRSWVMTWDRGLVPKDRIRDYPVSDFHGVPLGDGMRLPLAFTRRETSKRERGAAATKEQWRRYDVVPVDEQAIEIDGQRYFATRDGNHLIAAEDVSVARRRTDVPSRVTEGPATTWLDISIVGGWLVAYQGPEPVYATMISPGRGGLPEEGKTLLETASSPVGDFAITGKFHTATMTSNYSDKVVHSQVPYTQNFSGPYALHAAYWHDDWGVGKSGGCVNLSPTDAMRLFAWTEPRLPNGWHGMRGTAGDAEAYGAATVVSIHR